MTTILLVDDEEIVRSGLAMILSAEPDLVVVGECANGEEAVAAASALQPAVIVMDVRMPVMDGVEATSLIREKKDSIEPAVLMLTSFDVDDMVYAALRAGAVGVLLKHRTRADLVAAVRKVAVGEVALDQRMVRVMVDRFARGHELARSRPATFEKLTLKEREVLILAAEGLSNAEIAQRQFVELGTIKTHMSHVLAKLSVRDRAQAIAYVYRNELLAGRDD